MASIHALPANASGSLGARDRADVDADIPDATLPGRAFSIAAQGTATTLRADLTRAAVGSIVDLAVAVVVATVAGFRDRRRCRTRTPNSLVANFEAFTAGGLTGPLDIVVDLAIAVVVFAVADLGLRLRA